MIEYTQVISPIELHTQLLKEVNPICSTNQTRFRTFMEALIAKKYGKALRVVCANLNEETMELIKILLGYHNLLKYDINEQEGEENYAAIHHVAISKDQPLYDLLVQHGANEELPDRLGKTAKDYMPADTLRL